MGNNRKIYLDILKAIAIILVISGHVVQQFDSQYNINPIFIFIYSFHMPLFMLISGYLSFNKIDQICNISGVFNLILNRFFQLIIPFIVWTTIIVSINFFYQLMLHYLIPLGGILATNEYYMNLWF